MHPSRPEYSEARRLAHERNGRGQCAICAEDFAPGTPWVKLTASWQAHSETICNTCWSVMCRMLVGAIEVVTDAHTADEKG